MFIIDTQLLVVGILLLLGIASTKFSLRLGLPVLVLFLGLGMLAGSEGIGGIEFEDYRTAHTIGTVALAIILFDGGLGTSFRALRLTWKPAALLATWGVFVTALITGAAASWVLGISLMEGLLLGSIVGSTDAAAVFAVLRSGGVGLEKRIAAVLEVESAANDPMAIFLTIGCIEVLLGNMPLGPGLLVLFFKQMGIGTLCGLTASLVAVWITNRINLEAGGLYPVMMSAFCLLTYGLAASLGGSGFLAVFLAGVVIGNRRIVFQRGIRLFQDASAWLAQVAMFVVLGLLSFPSRLIDSAGKAILISIVLFFIARPVAVLLSVLPFRFTFKEVGFLSWVGLKGAVPITLATFPLLLSNPQNRLQAELIFDVVFFIVVLSATIQGGTLVPLARRLGLERPREAQAPVSLELHSLRDVQGDIVDYSVAGDSLAANRQVRDLALPEGAVIAILVRGEQVIPPQGRTVIEAGDHAILVLAPGTQPLVDQIFSKASDIRPPLPMTVEFPLRPDTTIADLQACYSLRLEAPTACTLSEVLRNGLSTASPQRGDTVRIGPVLLRVLRLSRDGQIELVGISILSEVAVPETLEPHCGTESLHSPTKPE